MAIHDYVIANQNGANTRSDLNNALAAIVSNNSSATAPTTTYAYMWWADTAADILKQRNAADSAWINILTLSTGAPLGIADDSLSGNKIDGGTISNFTSTGIDDNATSTAITIGADETVGIGVTPKTWDTLTAVQAGRSSAFAGHAASHSTYSLNNVYYNAGWKYISNSFAGMMNIGDGTFNFKVAPSGTADTAITWTTAMTINADASVYTYSNIEAGRIGSAYTGTGNYVYSWGGNNTSLVSLRGHNVADTTLVFDVLINNGRKIKFTGAGNGYWDGAADLGNADYAEYFEWADGNPTDEDRVGMSVSMVGNQVKIAEDGDVIMGIVSARPAVVGDSASLGWQGRYETDEFGRRIQEDVTIHSWGGEEVTDEDGNVSTTEKFEYRHDQIPEGVTIPANATSVVTQEDKYHADYDVNAIDSYVPRSDRKEWSAIGLMGKLKLRTGQVTDSRWIKMRDMSPTIEEWLVR